MTQTELDNLKKTFPWRTHIERQGVLPGGVIRVLDRNGQEVPILDMTAFLEIVTEKMARKAAEPPKDE